MDACSKPAGTAAPGVPAGDDRPRAGCLRAPEIWLAVAYELADDDGGRL